MAETIDEQFIEFIVKALVGNPDKVKINRSIDERGVLLELYVDPEDLGRVIGRNGGTAKSIRTLLRALGVKNDARYNLKIVDTNGGGRPHRDERPARSDAPVGPSPRDETVDLGTSDAPADDVAADDQASDAPTKEEEPKAEPTEEATPPAEAPKDEEDSLERHRKELEGLTDLDI